jgi:hypothetical protein
LCFNLYWLALLYGAGKVEVSVSGCSAMGSSINKFTTCNYW